MAWLNCRQGAQAAAWWARSSSADIILLLRASVDLVQKRTVVSHDEQDVIGPERI